MACPCSASRSPEEQAALARERVAEAGLADRVEIRVADYRELREPRFDAIASIGMVEHVGERRIDEYARKLASLLAPGGALLNHGIAALRPDDDAGSDAFTNRYVFPDAEPLLSLAHPARGSSEQDFISEHVEGFASRTTRSPFATGHGGWTSASMTRAGSRVPQRTRVWRLYSAWGEARVRDRPRRGLSGAGSPAGPSHERTVNAEPAAAALPAAPPRRRDAFVPAWLGCVLGRPDTRWTPLSLDSFGPVVELLASCPLARGHFRRNGPHP